MNKRRVAYWLATGLFCLAFTVGGVSNLLRDDEQREEMAALGYPDYLMTILGAAKLMGVIALIVPRRPLLKEWAYAGFTFDLLGAAASHAFVRHGPGEIAAPVILLVIGAVSYWMRPAARRISRTPPEQSEQRRVH